MVIEIVTWKGALRHAVNQDFPSKKTLCGVWVPETAEKLEDPDEFPTCFRCEVAVMRS